MPADLRDLAPGPRRQPPPRPRAHHDPATAATHPIPPAWSTHALRWLRRTHLFTGLLLLPFVLVYGVSAFLFNHGGERRSPDEPLAVTSEAANLAAIDTEALARRVAQALERDPAGPHAARLEGEWTFEYRQADGVHRLRLLADGSAATVRRLQPEAPRGTRLATDLFAAEAAAAEAAAQALLAAAGRAPTNLRRTGAPSLRQRGDGVEITTSLDRAQATVRPDAGFDFGRLLMRLHTAHGYGSDRLPRLAWAVVVDLMAGAMVLWALSGLTMWWQKRTFRRAGLWCLATMLAAAVALAAAMHWTTMR